jgi:HD-GYP domain-containing protein (c-di-GMP phosphodiesterase class II)
MTNGKSGLNKLPVQELGLGMYVANLDKDWLDSSFLVQGFYINNSAVLDRLKAECEHVYVDPRRYKRIDTKPNLRVVVSNDAPKKPAGNEPRASEIPMRQIAPRSPKLYTDSTATTDEIIPAHTCINDAIAIMRPIVDKVHASGHLEVEQVEAAVKPLVSSVLRNKDAVAALLRIRAIDDYTYSHSISNAVWAALLGRHLGFKPDQINKLALGCALLDVGKITVPQELLVKPGPLTDEEMELMRGHVGAGLEILEQSGITDRDVISMVAMHHERIDGSGYPRQLKGKAISAYAQIAGIVDTYDAMISERPYAAAMSSYDAVHKLHECAGVLFQPDLVEQLTQAIGVFPTGTLVELNTGEVGIVTEQNPERRLRPKISLVLNERKLPRTPIIADLNAMDTDSRKPLTVWITKELPQGAFGVDAAMHFTRAQA